MRVTCSSSFLRFGAALCASLALLWPHLAVGAPSWLNSGAQFANGNVTAGSSATVTTGATTIDIPAGSVVAITTSARVSSLTLNSCTDSLSTHNNYTVVGQTTTNLIVGAAISWTTQDLPIGSTFSCTWSSTSGGKAIIVAAATGFPSGAALDQKATNSGTGTGTLTTGPTAALAGTNDVVFGSITLTNAGTITEPGGWTNAFNNTTNSNQHMSDVVPGSAAAISYAPSTTGTSGTWGGIVVAVKPSGCTRLLLGEGPC